MIADPVAILCSGMHCTTCVASAFRTNSIDCGSLIGRGPWAGCRCGFCSVNPRRQSKSAEPGNPGGTFFFLAAVEWFRCREQNAGSEGCSSGTDGGYGRLARFLCFSRGSFCLCFERRPLVVADPRRIFAAGAGCIGGRPAAADAVWRTCGPSQLIGIVTGL